jgi:urocanate hydratase
MLYWDVNNGIARRAWARNPEALFSIQKAMQEEPGLKVTLPNLVDDKLISRIYPSK